MVRFLSIMLYSFLFMFNGADRKSDKGMLLMINRENVEVRKQDGPRLAPLKLPVTQRQPISLAPILLPISSQQTQSYMDLLSNLPEHLPANTRRIPLLAPTRGMESLITKAHLNHY